MKKLIPVTLVLGCLICGAAFGERPKPKLGPLATRLWASHEYIRKNKAPDFWALIPYYQAQQDDSACSLASVTMVVNAARADRKLTSDDELATQKNVLARTADEKWTGLLSGTGHSLTAHGVTLDELSQFTKEALEAFGVKGATVEVVHTDDLSNATRKRLHEALVQNEKSARDFIIINFIQGAYTGDADAGHIAPIAAFDAKQGQVLVLDPDRQWYEPYWVSEDTLLKGMATHDPISDKFRGYLWIKLK